ncbi:MAG: Holliday junction resolvase RuvX [Clostridiales bacterium]|jgi:putative Holliday junction resolvase|nr:Holliday junction resolvase RuvX [Clostridiales bacterium]
MQRVLAFDIGDKRIGLAVSDPLGITAQGLETYTRCGDEEKDVQYLLGVAQRYKPVYLLFGLPRNMDGSYGFQSEKVRAFVEALTRRWHGEYGYYDERLTTVSAEKALIEGNVKREKRRQVVDKLAAVIILQGYLEQRR